MQKIIIMGNLGNDPTFVETKGGAKMLSFNVAVNRKSGENRNTTWYRIKTMNFSQNFAKTLKKGSNVIVMGDLTVSSYTDKNGVERPDITIWADSMEFGPSTLTNEGQTGTTRTTQAVSNPTISQSQVGPMTPPVSDTSTGNPSSESELPF